MGIEKTKWRELGLTPRQLSKKIGVTYSMAEFIAQSYRVPVHIKGPQVACVRSARRQKSPKKNRCTQNAARRGRCGEAPALPALFSTSCSRKRGRPEEELSDCDDSSASCAWIEPKDGCESSESSCAAAAAAAETQTSSKGNCGKISSSACCGSPSGHKKCKVTHRPKARCFKRRRKPKPRRKRMVRARGARTAKCSPAARPCQKKQKLVPINIRLDIPVNIFLDEEDGIEMEKEAQHCKARRPPRQQDCNARLVSEECGETRPARSARQREEGDECPEETELEECVRCEDYVSGERAGCSQKAKAGDGCQLSWWEKIQECMVFFESLLSSLINKC